MISAPHVTPPRVLVIAGSDSSGGAGLQADLRTLGALGVHGATAVTAVTVQNSMGVSGVHVIPEDVVRAQIRAVLDDLGADAVKIGMLGSAALVEAVADELAGFTGPIVMDPVTRSSSGQALLDRDAVAVLTRRLLPMVAVVTPNLDEVGVLTGVDVGLVVGRTLAELDPAASRLLALGARWAVITGGHLGARHGRAVDLLTDGTVREVLTATWVESAHTHGTGCTFASALAAGLARGADVPTAARAAKAYLSRAIAAGYPLGAGPGPVGRG